MKIKMLKTKKGSPDGLTVNTYLAGQDYDMPDSLANVFVNQIYVAYVEPDLKNKIEVPEKEIKTETPKTVEMETPMKTIERPKRKRGRPKKTKE